MHWNMSPRAVRIDYALLYDGLVCCMFSNAKEARGDNQGSSSDANGFAPSLNFTQCDALFEQRQEQL